MGLDEARRMYCCGLMMKGKTCPHVVSLEGNQEWDRLWKMVADPAQKRCCFILALSKNSARAEEKYKSELVSSEIRVPDGTARTVELRLGEGVGVTVQVEIELGTGASFGLLVRGSVSGGAPVKMHVSSKQNKNGSRMVCRGRIVCRDGGYLELTTSGFVGAGTMGGACEYDMKILQSGTNSKVETKPYLEVLGKEVSAKHGCSIGRVPQGPLLYMQSRGLTKSEAEELYLKGFLS